MGFSLVKKVVFVCLLAGVPKAFSADVPIQGRM